MPPRLLLGCFCFYFWAGSLLNNLHSQKLWNSFASCCYVRSELQLTQTELCNTLIISSSTSCGVTDEGYPDKGSCYWNRKRYNPASIWMTAKSSPPKMTQTWPLWVKAWHQPVSSQPQCELIKQTDKWWVSNLITWPQRSSPVKPTGAHSPFTSPTTCPAILPARKSVSDSDRQTDSQSFCQQSRHSISLSPCLKTSQSFGHPQISHPVKW